MKQILSSTVMMTLLICAFLSCGRSSTKGEKEIGNSSQLLNENISPCFNSAKEMLAAGQFEDALAVIEEKEMGITQELMCLDSRDVNDANLEKRRQSLKKQLDELQWDEVQALLVLGEYIRAMVVLEEIRCSESVYRERADSLYELMQRE